MPIRIQIIGGFLGAGKTTLMTKLAEILNEDGSRVGLILNDQAASLVDTQYSESLGLDCCEVAGGCFCCRFPDFLENAREMVKDNDLSVVLAEPVGSCTDLLATVVAPLKKICGNEFQVAPLMIMVDCARAMQEGVDDTTLGGYLRKHQISEAEVVVLSKTDLVSEDDLERIASTLSSINGDARIIPYSSLNGGGLDEILEAVRSDSVSNRDPQDINYDTYAKAEAELGWYNGTFHSIIEGKVDSYALCRDLLERLFFHFPPEDIAHAKIMLSSQTNAAKMSAVMGRISVDAVGGSRYASGETVMTVNARIVSPPDHLAEIIKDSVGSSAIGCGITLEVVEEDFFSPAAPNPTYRMG